MKIPDGASVTSGIQESSQNTFKTNLFEEKLKVHSKLSQILENLPRNDFF
jgi:hypothetical protein